MKTFRSIFLGALVILGAVLFLGSPATVEAQTSVPAYTTVVADAWSDWYWDCGWWDYHYDYDWWWGPGWYYGFGWYSGSDWTWTPSWWWYDYLYYYYCYWVWVEIYGTSLVQVPNTSGSCTYNITVNFSDGSSQNFTQQGNGGAINLYFTHSATDPTPTGATATETCAPPPDLRIKCYGEDVTNATKTLAIGEVAQFTVEVGPGTPNVSITSVQWSQPPNAFKDYTFTIASGAAVPLSASDLASQTLTLFYISPRTEETLTATVTTNQGQAQVSTRVTVVAPGSSFTTTTTTVRVAYVFDQNTGELHPEVGWQHPGITFTYSVDNSAGSGEFFIVQVLNSEHVSGTCDSNGQTLVFNDGTKHIDVPPSSGTPRYPYESDRPSIFLRQDLHSLTIQENFTAYLMFKPSALNAHAVAIRKVNWSWGATALKSGSAWSLSNSSHSENPGSVAAFDLPVWSGLPAPPGDVLPPCPQGGGGAIEP